MYLAQVKTKDKFRIRSIMDSTVRMHFLRVGLREGSTVECAEKIPFGPVVLKMHFQKIAIGREFARMILVDKLWAR